MAGVNWVVVVPTNRPPKMRDFIDAWKPLFTKHKVHLVIMEDGPERSDFGKLDNFTHLCWEDMTTEYIPQRTDMVRSFAFYYVYTEWNRPEYWNYDQYILTLDDDVTPDGDIFEAYERVFQKGAPFSKYLDVGSLTTSGVNMRGFPYKDRKKSEVAVQYGGWHGTLDYDAATQLSNPLPRQKFKDVVMPVPQGIPTTCCIMNTAWHIRYTPIMWQLPMLPDRYNRIGDIWSGLFIKKTLDHLGAVMMINGEASVIHDRASDPYNSLIKEAPSVWLNDNLWDKLQEPRGEMLTAYKFVTDDAYNFFRVHDKGYAELFKRARDEWLDLYKPNYG